MESFLARLREAPTWLTVTGSAAAAAALCKAAAAASYSCGRADLRGRAVFISGCDSGFGYSLALHCSSVLGMRVIAGCYAGAGGAEEKGISGEGARSLEENSGGLIHVVDLDLTDESSVRSAAAAAESILSESGSELFCVVNNAATLVFGEAEWQTRELVRRQMSVNVEGALSLTSALLPLLRDTAAATKPPNAPPPRVVNVISFCTDCPLPTLAVYTASKAALRSLSAGMRMELSKFGVAVVLFNPGDHPAGTPLCAGQGPNYDDMERSLESECRDFGRFRSYFSGCRDKFTSLFPGIKEAAKPLDDPGFYRTFTDLASARRPRPEYANAPLAVRAFYGILGALPTSLSDAARIAMMRLPKL